MSLVPGWAVGVLRSPNMLSVCAFVLCMLPMNDFPQSCAGDKVTARKEAALADLFVWFAV
jgi:hypothetical protein